MATGQISTVTPVANAVTAGAAVNLGATGGPDKYYCFGIRETTGATVSPGRLFVAIEIYSGQPNGPSQAIGCPLGFYYIGTFANQSVPWKPVGGLPFKIPGGSTFRIRVAGGSGTLGTEVFEGFYFECDEPVTPYVEPFGSGQGDQVITSYSNPAAGAEVSVSYAGKVHFQFATFYATLVSSGAVNRQVAMERQGSAGTAQAESGLGPAQATGLTWTYIWEEGWPVQAGSEVGGFGTRVHLPASNRTRKAGASDKFVTSTLNLQAGDQWSAIKIVAEEWAGVTV